MAMHRFTILALFCVVALLPCPAVRAEEELFEVRAQDEVFFNDGSVAKGIVSETDEPGKHKIRDILRGTYRPFTAADVKVWKKKSTKETELARLADKYKGQPAMLLKVAREATTRFDGLVPTTIAMLEKEAGSSAEALDYLAQLYLQTAQPALALATADKIVRAAPTQARGYLRRGMANLASDKTAEAQADLEKAFQMAPENQDVVVTLADYYLRSGQGAKANELFTGALAKNPNNVAALVGQGMLFLRQGDFPQAEVGFKKSLGVDSNHKQALVGLAAVKVMNGNWTDAYETAKGILNLDNRCADAITLQAFAKLLSGEADSLDAFAAKAKESFNLRPVQPRLLLACAAALERSAALAEVQGTADGLAAAEQKRKEAATKFDELVSSDPQDAFLQYLIGERKFKANPPDNAAAEAAFQKAAKLSPGFAPAHAAVGAVSLRLQKWDAAREAYSKAIGLDAKVGDYHSGKGLALLKAKQFEEAQRAFRQALDLDRSNVTALCGMGYVLNAEKNKNAAISFFQQALAADGNCEYAAAALRKIYAQENMHLEYVTFAENEIPSGWRQRAGGTVKPSVVNGRVLFSGTQGAAQGGKVELYKDVPAAEFVRIEADLEIPPQSQTTFGVRISSATLAMVTFELEFGKDDSNEIKVRYKDYGGKAPNWESLKTKWPADGRVRLGIDTDDLRGGKMHLWINGENAADVDLSLQRPTRISAGVFLQAPPKEVVQAFVDNIVLVTRGTAGGEGETGGGLILKAPEERKGPPVEPEKKATP